MRLSKHFSLLEFVPRGYSEDDVPPAVLSNLRILCTTVLDPVRDHFNCPLLITSGWRPKEYNAKVGGTRNSDHIFGRAADWILHPDAANGLPWPTATMQAWKWIAHNLSGKFGQLIWEDKRHASGRMGALWVHVSIPSVAHPGDAVNNRLLFTLDGKNYSNAHEDLFGGSEA